LQLGLFAAHGVAIVPEVTSLKIQALAGTELELQFAFVCADEEASLYKTWLAFPCPADPVYWLTIAKIPAKAGVETEVPPIPKKS
jgi:hypothetical protein